MGRKKAQRTRARIRAAAAAASTPVNEAPEKKVGLFVTKELDSAIAACKEKVQRIASECRERNKRFRDLEFDMEFDAPLCLHGLSPQYVENIGRDVQRITEIFDEPHFFPVGGAATSNAINQGDLGDCWFLAALATVSCIPGLIEKICVAKDEEIGVYGFIFYGDNGWSSVVIDDMLCTNIPKYEELPQETKEVYHEDKQTYNRIARKNGAYLTYARAGSQMETWVPLIEKAYAKYYGNYAHLDRGYTREGIEDLTGGIATAFITKDIFNLDRFWNEELLKANKDRLFSCSFNSLSTPSDDLIGDAPTVHGLIGNHAYAVLRAMEAQGKRFVVLRNPWGRGEWTGTWSDGSKEWTPEWLRVLPELGHTFGDDGQFVMEYGEFMGCFNVVERTYLFDDSWIVASQWAHVPLKALPTAWSYGNLSFEVKMPARSKAVLVLSQLNTRAFRSIRNSSYFMIDLAVVKKGERVPLETASEACQFTCRSISVEMELDEGEYFVYVRIDQSNSVSTDNIVGSDYGYSANSRTLSRLLSSKVKSYSLATNWESKAKAPFMAKSLEDVIEADLTNLAAAKEAASKAEIDEPAPAAEANGGEKVSNRAVEERLDDVGEQGSNGKHDDSKRNPDTSVPDTISVDPDGAVGSDSLAATVSNNTGIEGSSSKQLTRTQWEVLAQIVLVGCLNILALFGLTIIGALEPRQEDIPTQPMPAQEQTKVPNADQHSDVGSVSGDSDDGDYSPPQTPRSISSRSSTVLQGPYPPAQMLGAPPLSLYDLPGNGWKELMKDEIDSIILGLRVYTQTKDPAGISYRIGIDSNNSTPKDM